MLPSRIFPMFLVLFVLACGEVGAPFDPDPRSLDHPLLAAAAISSTDVQRVPTAFSQFVPCANDGLGEVIEWTGEWKLVSHSTTLRTREGDFKMLLTAFHATGSLTGIGQATGDRYLGRYSQHVPVHESEILDSASFDTNLVFDILIRSVDGPLVGIQRVRAHSTIDGQGRVVVQRFDFRFTCRQG